MLRRRIESQVDERVVARITWSGVVMCLLAIVLFASAAGCTGTTAISITTTEEQWEQKKGRFTLNGAIEEAHVKSLRQYRKEHKAVKE